MHFNGKRILLGVSGGIACYKAVELARRLVTAGAQVKVVMTKGAQEFVTPLTFAAITGQTVGTGLFGPGIHPLEHIWLGQQVDALILAPATANLIGKFAAGIGDDLLTTILLAATRPVLLCPAMNCEMYANPVVQENLARLEHRGVTVLRPGVGPLACGAVGYGRLPEVEDMLAALSRLVSPQDLAGRHLLVTAGPTHEDLDPVRFLTNRSSGKMGYAVAKAAWRRGAEVTLVSGPTALPPPYGVEVVQVRAALELLAVLRERFPTADALIMAAAVSDYRPESLASTKLKRGSRAQELRLVQNPDIVKELAALKTHQVLVGFAAETGDLLAEGRRKLEEKNLDLIVANEVNRPDAGFAVDTNEVTLIPREGEPLALPLMSKDEVAERLLDWLAERLGGREAQGG
ncbi:MAG: bifunctional phosphopantothenoylcysteine decarboxylase/phosphopantothenate--cysteine ligase CoaBC [Syntrophobacterales bacterium]|nr:bifunctional phosphopantothenoylcysteine decarboxylase/phosphopantothenate--cysteine ligase CoaBC [Syntrophobacterales bacterium]